MVTAKAALNPPVTPAWAFGHIAWEDSINTSGAAIALVDGYLQRNIPVGAVIIDSPWSTGYNDFNWDTRRYPDPVGMINHFKDENVKVLLWLTGAVNIEGKDTPLQKCEVYDEVVAKGYAVNNGEPHNWWKGKGVHIDFTNKEATEWWYKQLDKVFIDGVYGWKVDQGEYFFGDFIDTSIGKLSNEQFRPYYYKAMFDYTVGRNPAGIIIARPYSHQGGYYAGLDKVPLGWCGDFMGDWHGLKLQIQNIYISAKRGYGAPGCEVGGFYVSRASKEQFVRYAQFGAMTACMINGGENGAFTNHLPWWHGEDVADIYRYCVKLHYELVPYLFSTVVDAHLRGGSLIKNASFEEESHQLGDCLFTKAITSENNSVAFHLPADGEWFDFFSGRRYAAGSLVEETYPLERFPLFVKAGAILPLCITDDVTGLGDASMSGRQVVVVYPNGNTSRLLHLPTGEGVEYEDCLVGYDENIGELRVDAAAARPFTFILKDMPEVTDVRNAAAWNYDAGKHELRIDAEGDRFDICIKE
ncbi:MAG: hypothetical protein LUC23_03335 [Prevotellaceae bacterium]|nr:hypothetical protein [Prevotellaceae bacterium]